MKYCPHNPKKLKVSTTDCDLCAYEKYEASLPVPTPGARRTDPDTSHAAHAQHDPTPHQLAILRAADEHGMGTEEMFAQWTGIERTSLSPQFRPMIRHGILVDIIDTATGKKLKWRNPTSGVLALVRGLPRHQKAVQSMKELFDQRDATEPGSKEEDQAVDQIMEAVFPPKFVEPDWGEL